jgi:uncharacterized protein (DUF1800 family)
MKASWRWIGPALLALGLAACGGGDGGGGTSGGSTGGGSSAPPAAAPVAVTQVEAFRFLNQSTFGATEADATSLRALGGADTAYARWIDQQLAVPATLHLPTVLAAFDGRAAGVNAGAVHADRVEWWLRQSVQAPDQLRQRVAFALSEILVVSQLGGLQELPLAVTDYYDILVRGAFGNYRQLLKDVTLSPGMGVYLSMLGNQKADPVRNIRPDENYARELLQLFTIGLVELAPDGTVRRDSQGQPIPTFDQATVEGFAQVFTGWKWAWTVAGTPNFATVRSNRANQMVPMQAYPEQHETASKRLLGTTVLPAGQTMAKDLDDALDAIFAHPNMGSFLVRQLIQRLVTSNPSPAYVARVAARFENDGSGVRGNLGAVIRAILLDDEARVAPATPQAGKLKEPLLRLTQLWRAYGARAANGRYLLQPAAAFGQAPLQSPSVFNFFSPKYAPPGEITNGGFTAPEMQIATEFQNTSLTNFLFGQVFSRISS